MEEKKKTADEKKPSVNEEEQIDPRLVMAMARKRLTAVILAMVFSGILLLYLVANKPSDAELRIHAHAREQGISALQYPDELVELLDENAEAEEFVLNYPFREEDPEIDLSNYDLNNGVPLFMQWDERWGYMEYGDGMVAVNGCGPMCLSMAGYYVTGSARFYPDRIVDFAAKNDFYSDGNGSKWTLISVGGPALGLQVKELALVEGKIADYLQGGSPIIAVMGPGDFTASGHFIVLTGYDNGMLTVNDPNSYVNSGKQWDFDDIKGQIKNLWVIQKG